MACASSELLRACFIFAASMQFMHICCNSHTFFRGARNVAIYASWEPKKTESWAASQKNRISSPGDNGDDSDNGDHCGQRDDSEGSVGDLNLFSQQKSTAIWKVVTSRSYLPVLANEMLSL